MVGSRQVTDREVLTPEFLLKLQRQAGNQAVVQFIRALQPAVGIGAAEVSVDDDCVEHAKSKARSEIEILPATFVPQIHAPNFDDERIAPNQSAEQLLNKIESSTTATIDESPTETDGSTQRSGLEYRHSHIRSMLMWAFELFLWLAHLLTLGLIQKTTRPDLNEK